MAIDAPLLGQVPLFGALPPEELEMLATTLRRVSYPSGTVLFPEGDRGDRFFVVLDGAIEVIKAMDTEDERVVAVRCAGEFVGEMSLLNQDGLRTASARVREDAYVLELTRADFDALLRRYPTLAYEMLRVMSMRLGTSHEAAIRDLHERNERLAQAYADLQAAQAQIIEQKTLARELELAREIQESMLPPKLPKLQGFDVGARMVPARMVGGDFFDVLVLDQNKLGLVIGDVSGKGVPAALFMALTCSLLRAEASRAIPPKDVLINVNRQLLTMNAKGMFVTVLFGVLDRAAHAFSYVRAGHDLPRIWYADGTVTEVPRGSGHPLGILEQPQLDEQAVVLPPGSTLLLYTDGVTEATDPEGEFFGLEQLDQTFHQIDYVSAQNLCDQLVSVLTGYHSTAPQSDDITLVAVRVDAP